MNMSSSLARKKKKKKKKKGEVYMHLSLKIKINKLVSTQNSGVYVKGLSTNTYEILTIHTKLFKRLI